MNDDKVYIYVETGDDDTDLKNMLNEVSSLPSVSFGKKPKEREKNEEVSFTELKKKKKKKPDKKESKKKKSSISEDDLMFSSMVDDIEKVESTNSDEFDDYMDNLEEIYIREVENRVDEEIIDAQKNSYGKLKKQDNQYKKEFAEESTLLYNLLDEVNKFGKIMEKDFDAIKNSKTRGTNKYTNDLIASIINNKNSKLSIIKELTSLKKTIADLKLKEDSKNDRKNAAQNQGSDYVAASYFKQIMNHGRNNFIKDMEQAHTSDLAQSLDMDLDAPNGFDLDNYDKILDDRLSDETNPFRTDSGSKYIEYENRGVKIYIKKCIDSGEWEFVALDEYQQQIYDYPLPQKKNIGKVKFSDDGEFATDERGRSYKVISFFSNDTYEEE